MTTEKRGVKENPMKNLQSLTASFNTSPLPALGEKAAPPLMSLRQIAKSEFKDFSREELLKLRTSRERELSSREGSLTHKT